MSYDKSDNRERKRLLKEVERPEDFLPNTFGYHEALHTAHICSEMLDTHLCSHPSVLADKKAHKLAHKAFEAAFDLYQYLGSQHLEPDEKS